MNAVNAATIIPAWAADCSKPKAIYTHTPTHTHILIAAESFCSMRFWSICKFSIVRVSVCVVFILCSVLFACVECMYRIRNDSKNIHTRHRIFSAYFSFDGFHVSIYTKKKTIRFGWNERKNEFEFSHERLCAGSFKQHESRFSQDHNKFEDLFEMFSMIGSENFDINIYLVYVCGQKDEKKWFSFKQFSLKLNVPRCYRQ